MPRQLNADGFAQIIALTGLAALGGMIAALQLQTIGATRAQSALQQTVAERLAAESATRRVFAAIENDDDALEATLAHANGSLRLNEAGLEMTILLEREGGKISASNSSSELVQSYLANLGVADPSPVSTGEVQSPATLRAIVTIGLLRQGVDASYDQDFSSYHLSPGVNPLFASEPVLGAIPDLTDWDREDILRERHTGTINASSSFFSTDVSALSLVSQSPGLGLSFAITAGGRVEILGNVF